MSLLDLLRSEAIERGVIEAETEIDAPQAFALVRDMPYRRASSHAPQTTILEWCGTCSGKHYLLRALFGELGFRSDLIACTTESYIDPAQVPEKLGEILKRSSGRFIDVHNYLVLKLPEGDMVVDATWPVSTKAHGLTVNTQFKLGEDQKIASTPIQIWVVPKDRDPQEFKEEILRENYSQEELKLRDEFIQTLSRLLND